VYSSSTAPVTTGSTKTNVAALGRDADPRSPIGAGGICRCHGGERRPAKARLFSPGVCAVPTAGRPRPGLTMYDPLCGDALDGKKWQNALVSSRGVSGGAMVLSSQVTNHGIAGRSAVLNYQTTTNVDRGPGSVSRR